MTTSDAARDARPHPAQVQAAQARCSEQRLPLRRAARRVRLRGEPGALVFCDVTGREHRLEVGEHGIDRAVHVGGPALAEVAPEVLGAVDLLLADGTRRARLDLRDWLPEAVEMTDSAEALRRSQLVPVLEAAGLPLRPLAGRALAEAVQARVVRLVPLPPPLPWSFTVVRTVAVMAAVVALLPLGLDESRGTTHLVAASALLASTLFAGALWVRALVLDRVDDGGAPVLRPHPAGPATRRFLRTARLRLEPDEVVVVDGLGTERRLPREGPVGITELAVTREGTARARVEARTADGTPRAALPWKYWCAGEGGERALEEVARAGRLALTRNAPPARQPAAQDHWARRWAAPVDRHGAALMLRTPPGLPGNAAALQTSAFAAYLLLWAALDDRVGGLAVALLVLTLALAAGAPLVRLLVRRLWLDAPVRSRRR